ncbi:transglycosylase domain-containing protein [Dermabacter sp. HSID17554]|uniref:transglycosylase domain-containing protein n=1 Tax=Dermabacter sp. HSID17554 TaxID=2419511 RepID=UPI000F87D9CE|nr:transglycosylase domain-containing protein [Dermabacter sp. HSID17554]RUP86443.1 penicillin-binding protein [Dermabacter sp. HSID17554]
MSDKTPKGTSRTRSSGKRAARAATTPAAASLSRSRTKPRPETTTRTPGRPSDAPSSTPRGNRRAKNKPKPTNLLNYPRAGREGFWRWWPSWRLLSAVFVLLFFAGIGFGAWLYATTDVPEPTDIAVAQTTRVYYADGETLIGEFSDLNRTILPADEIPDNVKEAVVASEDSTFYENRGISPKGIVRALVNNLSGGSRQGASTITQQYVENYYTGKVTSYTGKVREMIMAVKIDQELDKNEILSRYLNTIYFGRSAYGIEEAAQAYFGKSASELDDAEAALLVAVIPAPSAYDPAKNPDKAKALWQRVIDREVNETGTLTKEEADKLSFPETIEYKRQSSLRGTNGYLMMTVRKELEARGFDEDDIDTGGYTIVSTIDKHTQESTVEAINDLPEDRPENNHVGTVSIDPSTGAIRALYGGEDYLKQQRNDATQSRMQAGSTFKAFTLVAALEEGYSLHSHWDASSPRTFKGWTVKNFGNASRGSVDLLTATRHSYNTPYAALNVDMGAEKTREAAIKMGLSEKTPGLDDSPSNVLGSSSLTVLELAGSYSVIASGGIKRTPHIVEKVTNADGSHKYAYKDDGERVLKESTAINATVALQEPTSSRGSARIVNEKMDGRPVAGKTGTSSSFRSALFVGYTPQLVTAVGMFQPSADGRTEEPLTPFGPWEDMTGGGAPASIFADIMTSALDGQDEVDFHDEVDSEGKKKRKKRKKRTHAPRRTTQPKAPAQPSEQPSEEPPATEEPSEEAPEPAPEPSEQPTPSSKPEKPKPEPEPSEKPKTPKVQPTRGNDKPVEPTVTPKEPR